MLEESSKKHNKNTYAETANNKIICKDGFCSLPTQKDISKQDKKDINLFDPI